MRVPPIGSRLAASALALLSLQLSGDARAFDTSTSMLVNALDGTVDFCFSPDCNVSSPSLTIIPKALLQNTTVDSTKTVTGSTILGDFTTTVRTQPWMTTPSYDSNTSTYGSVLYARSCFTGCEPSPSNAFNYLTSGHDYNDEIELKVEYTQHVQQASLQSVYESYTVPSGALTMNMNLVFSPPNTIYTTISYFAVSFLLVAVDSDGTPTSNVTIENYPDGKMNLTRIHLGSQMYLDLPKYGTVNGTDTMIEIGATNHTSGDLKDLIEITLVFPSALKTINYAFAVASDTLRASGNTTTAPSPSSFAPLTTPPPTTTMPSISTLPRMVMHSRGEFSLCGESNCSSGVVSMGFTGLASNSTNVKRFANSPAFIFESPQVSGHGGAERYTSFFSAYVPQSRVRPLRPTSTGVSFDAVFSAVVDQYSDSVEVPYAGTVLKVPKGAVKYSILIREWQFASTNEVLKLNMSVQIQDAQNSSERIDISNATMRIEGNMTYLKISDTKQLELPMVALVDGVSKPIQVEPILVLLSSSPEVYGFTIAFTFPMFASSLFYDPVLRAGKHASTDVPLDQVKKTGSRVVAIVLLVFLALIVVVSIIRCSKKVKLKLDFSKIIP